MLLSLLAATIGLGSVLIPFLARAFAHVPRLLEIPEILIIDEVLAVGDAPSQQRHLERGLFKMIRGRMKPEVNAQVQDTHEIFSDGLVHPSNVWSQIRFNHSKIRVHVSAL
jgi:hypothetical protein